jgi:hypothetical protein
MYNFVITVLPNPGKYQTDRVGTHINYYDLLHGNPPVSFFYWPAGLLFVSAKLAM